MCRWLVTVGDFKFVVNSQPDEETAINMCKNFVLQCRPKWYAHLNVLSWTASKIFMETGWPITVVSVGEVT